MSTSSLRLNALSVNRTVIWVHKLFWVVHAEVFEAQVFQSVISSPLLVSVDSCSFLCYAEFSCHSLQITGNISFVFLDTPPSIQTCQTGWHLLYFHQFWHCHPVHTVVTLAKWIIKRGPANLSLFLKVVLLYEYLTKCKKQGQFKNLHLKCS